MGLVWGSGSGGLRTRPTAFPLWPSEWKLWMAFNRCALRLVWGTVSPCRILAWTFCAAACPGVACCGDACSMPSQSAAGRGGRQVVGTGCFAPPPQHPQGIWGTRAPKWAQWCAQIPCACCNLHVDHCCPPAVPFHPPLCGAFLASPPTGFLNVLPPSTPLSSPS